MKSKANPYIFIAKIIAVTLLIGYLVFKIVNEPILSTFKALSIYTYTPLITAVGLVFLNWGLEAKKWQLMIQPIQKISFLIAFKSVLSGLASGLLTPNRLGNFFGRLIYLKKENHNQAIVNTQTGNLAQFISTILMGLIGVMVVLFLNFNLLNPILITVISLAFLTVGFLLYFKPTLILKLPVKRFLSEKTLASLSHVSEFSLTFKLKILGLSLLRYFIFTLQYYLLFKLFQPVLSFNILSLISVTFLLTTIIPSFFFGKLFVRESVAVFVFTMGQFNTTLILLIAFLLWMINLAIPAIIGSIFWLKQKQHV